MPKGTSDIQSENNQGHLRDGATAAADLTERWQSPDGYFFPSVNGASRSARFLTNLNPCASPDDEQFSVDRLQHPFMEVLPLSADRTTALWERRNMPADRALHRAPQ